MNIGPEAIGGAFGFPGSDPLGRFSGGWLGGLRSGYGWTRLYRELS